MRTNRDRQARCGDGVASTPDQVIGQRCIRWHLCASHERLTVRNPEVPGMVGLEGIEVEVMARTFQHALPHNPTTMRDPYRQTGNDVPEVRRAWIGRVQEP